MWIWKIELPIIFYNTSSTTIFIHWNIFKNKQEVAALKLKQHFNNDRQCNIWKSSVRNVQGLKQSSRFHGPTRHLDYFFLLLLFSFFYLGLNLFSGAYWRGNRKSIYSRNLIKLHNQNRKMCFCENYGGAQPFTFSYKYKKIKLRNKILGL